MNDIHRQNQALHEATLRLLGLLATYRIEDELLQKGIEALALLLQARYGAIALEDESGKLRQFVYTGITAGEAGRIGHPPEGRGLLGVTTPLCLEDMSRDPRSVGFPPNHPPMKSLLSVHFSHEGHHYGRVYLSEKHDGSAFTEADKQLLTHFSNVFALMLAYHRSQAGRERAAEALRDISQTLSSITGETFFRELVLNLTKALGVEYAFVGEVTDESCGAIRTVAVSARSRIVDNFVYQLPGTPCENVVGKELCSYARDVQHLFPDDHMLVEMGIESYVGSPLFDSRGKPIGILVILDGKPLADPKHAESILKICAGRAAAELERLHQESVLRTSEERFRHLTELSSDWYWEQDADFRFTLVTSNSNTGERFTAEQTLGKTRWEHPYVDVPPGQWEEHKAQLRAHQPFYDLILKRKDTQGRIRIVSISGVPIFDPQGRFQGYRGTGRDLTEHMQAIQASRENEERLRGIVENAPICIHTIDMNGRVTGMNRAGLHMLGVEQEAQVCGMEMLAAVSEADRSRIRDLMQQAFQGNRAEFEFVTVNGNIFASSFIPVRDAKGDVQYLLGVTEDITARKQAEEQLHANLEGLRVLHAVIADPKLAFDRKIHALLALGCRRFNLPIGILAHIEGDRYTVMDVIAPNAAIAQGNVFPLGKTYCSETSKTTEPVSFEHAGQSRWKSHPCYTEFKLEAYLAIAIHVGGKPYGTINFSSPEPRKLVFTDTDREILKLMAQWVGSELERRQAEAISTRLGRILDASSNEIYVFDADTLRFIQVNQGAQRNLGYTMEDLKTLTPLDLKPEFTRQSFEALLTPLRRGEQGLVAFVTTHRRKDGSTYPVEVHLHLSQSEHPPVFVAVIQDITERKRTEERLSYLAYYDALTSLPNRQLLNERLSWAMTEADARDRLVAVMFLDLDRFKTINDTLGHDVGDALLKSVAERLKACVRPGDTISRLGGDEFTIVLANVAHVDDVARVAQKILDQFIAPFRIAGRDLFASPSIGITLYPFDDNNTESLLKNADTAMYHAKSLGRNNFQFYTAELNARAARQLELETGMRHALEREEFVLHYQPLVNMQKGLIVGMEALLRWQHPEYGLIPPMEFIPLAEETGLIVPIGEWVLRTACAQIKVWHATGFPALHVAVNLSSKQLQKKNFAEVVKQALRETGLEPRYLDLELTESLLMQDMEAAEAILKELKDLGALISLDDFGTGYSSLSYLKRFPIDFLKIDRSFVKDIAHDRYGAGIVRAIIVMAHTLGIKVIAEGVETSEQFGYLRDQGCDISQGYFCSKPLAVETFTELLHDWRRIRQGKCNLRNSSRKTREKQTRHPKRPSTRRPARR